MILFNKGESQPISPQTSKEIYLLGNIFDLLAKKYLQIWTRVV